MCVHCFSCLRESAPPRGSCAPTPTQLPTTRATFSSWAPGDFLPYVLFGIPTHVFGWVMHSMTTTALLKSVGAEPGTATVAAASAAIKWLSKDGLGAMGRLLVGSRLGIAPDVDPKRMRLYAGAPHPSVAALACGAAGPAWRNCRRWQHPVPPSALAELLALLGSALEMSTIFNPQYFLVGAGAVRPRLAPTRARAMG